MNNSSSIPEEFDWSAFDNLNTSFNTTDLFKQPLCPLKVNEVTEGEVTGISKREILVKIGNCYEGNIMASEFRYNSDLKVGDKVAVLVVSTTPLILSHSRARFKHSWDKVCNAYSGGLIVQGNIITRTKGGMIVRIFDVIDAFLPGSQIENHTITDFDQYVGRCMDFKIINVDTHQKNVVISHVALLANTKQSATHLRDNRVNKPRQLSDRVIGIVRFYNKEKDFGFIDTNYYSCDVPESMIGGTNELFFRAHDIKDGSKLISGCWVTCEIKKTEESKSDRARYICSILPSKADFELALKYVGKYSIINDGNFGMNHHSYDVLKDVIKIFMMSEDGQKVIWHSFLDILKNETNDCTIDALLNSQEAVELFLKTKYTEFDNVDDSVYQYSILKLATLLGKRICSTLKQYKSTNETKFLTELLLCIDKLNEESRLSLCNAIYEYCSTIELDVKCFWGYLPNATFITLVDRIYERIPGPEVKMHLFYVRGCVDVLMDSSIVDFFNSKGKEEGSAGILHKLTSGGWNEEKKRSFISYVLSTGKANYIFILALFLWSHESRCLEYVQDREEFSSIIYNEIDYVKKMFYSAIEYVPEMLAKYVLLKNGPKNILRSVYADKALMMKVFERFPKEYVITLTAYIGVISENKRVETSDWYGGYWTWGEGMKHEKNDTTTVLDLEYNCCVVTNSSLSQKLGSITDEVKTLIQNGVEICMREHSTESFIVNNKTDDLIKINLHYGDVPSMANYTEIVHINNKVSIILSVETYED